MYAVAVRRYGSFRIVVRSSPATNDHEVRFFGDSDDLIARLPDQLMGMDPDDILGAATPLRSFEVPHMVTVARCSCGVPECGSAEVEIARRGEDVTWIYEGRVPAFAFPAAEYESEVARAISDTSWETPDRTAARLTASRVDRNILASHGLLFQWASGRVRDGRFTVSLELQPGPYQVLVHILWRGESPEFVAAAMRHVLKQEPRAWGDVEWLPQGELKHAPLIAGPGWKLG